MRSVVLIFSLLLSASFMHVGAQSKKELFSKAGKQRHQTTKSGKLSGFTGKSGMLPDSIEQYSYDPIAQEYAEFPSNTDLFTYDQDGNVIERITHLPPYNSYRYTYVYSNGKEIEKIRYNWNPSTSSWFPTDRDQVLSNQFGVDTAEIYSSYDTTTQSWIEMSWDVYSIEYDINNRPLFTTYKAYDALAQTWEIYERIQFNYAGTDTIPFEVYVAEWDGVNWNDMYWVPRIKWEMGFSPNLDYFEPTLILGYEWDGANWMETFYDSSVVVDGHVEDYYSFEFDADSQYFVLVYSSHYSYDTYGNEISAVDLEWTNGVSDTSYIVLNEIVYGASGEVREWVYRSFSGASGNEYRTKDIYYYGPNSLVSAERIWVNIYPNPVGTAQKLFIQSETPIEQVQLYSYDGALVRTWKEYNSQGMDIQGLSSGIYLIHMADAAGNTNTQRLQIR
ncbi:MAG: T9SS type A sorting domain-containing protein [Bacteroidia bacterium]